MTLAQLESRVRALELEMEKLRAAAPIESKPVPSRDRWWERIHGTFENDDAFKEAMRLGREWRTGKKAKSPSRTKKTRRRAK